MPQPLCKVPDGYGQDLSLCKSQSPPSTPYTRDKPQLELQHLRAQLSPLSCHGQTDGWPPTSTALQAPDCAAVKPHPAPTGPREFCEVSQEHCGTQPGPRGMPGELEGKHIPLLQHRASSRVLLGGTQGCLGGYKVSAALVIVLGGCTVGNPSVHPWEFCMAHNPGVWPCRFSPWLNPMLMLEDFAP